MDAKITVITRGKVVGQQAVGGRPPRYASVPCKLTISSYLFTRWHLFRHVGYLRHQLWPLSFWPWNWCPSHVRRGLPLFQFWSSYASLFSSWARCTRQTSDRRQTKSIA